MVIAGVAIGTFLLRVTPFVVRRNVKLPPAVLEWMIFVSIGVTAGLVSKAMFVRDSAVYLEDLPVQAVALLVASLLQKKYDHILLSLVSGVGTAVFIRFLQNMLGA